MTEDPGASALGATNWAALHRGDVDHVVRAYWKPIFRFLRSRLSDSASAEDLTQEFFLKFIQRDLASRADPSRGRFRSYLYQLARRFLVDYHRERSAEKRGGAVQHVPLEPAAAPPAQEAEPAGEFDRAWFLDLVHRARRELKKHYAGRDRPEVYLAFRLFYFGSREPGHWSQQRIAERLGGTVAQVNNHVHRAREIYARILRDLVADYAGGEQELEEEIRDIARFLERHRVEGAAPGTLYAEDGDADSTGD